MKLCTQCLRDGNRTRTEGRFKMCEPCRWKRNSANKAWRAANYQRHIEHKREYDRKWKRQSEEFANTVAFVS